MSTRNSGKETVQVSDEDRTVGTVWYNVIVSDKRYHNVTGSARSSWRITVRQLESMIRLSEAMARMSCCDEVQPKHVQEAFRLLNKSIIRVETPDIDFEDDQVLADDTEEGVMNGDTIVNGDGGMNGEGKPLTNGVHDDQDYEEEKVKKAPATKVRVTYEEYKHIANMLIIHLRQLEEAGEEGIVLKCDY